MTVNMGTVWDRTTEFLGDNVRVWLPVVLLVILLPQAIGDILQHAAGAIGNPLAQGLRVVLTLIALWGQLFVVALALDPDAGSAAARSAATGGYGRALLVMLALFVAIIVLLVPLGIVLEASGVDLAQATSGQPGMARPDISVGAGLFFALYFLALLVVFLFVAARFTALYPILLAERRGLSAIGRSFAVTRGLTWKLIGVWLLFLIVFAVIAAAARSVIGVFVGLFFPADGNLAPATVVSAILGAAVTTAFTLVIAAFSTRLYRAVVPVSVGAAEAA